MFRPGAGLLVAFGAATPLAAAGLSSVMITALRGSGRVGGRDIDGTARIRGAVPGRAS